jgi:hypothetical protein
MTSSQLGEPTLYANVLLFTSGNRRWSLDTSWAIAIHHMLGAIETHNKFDNVAFFTPPPQFLRLANSNLWRKVGDNNGWFYLW